MSATVEFDQSLDPRQRLAASAVSLRLLPDSTPVKVASVLPKPVDDSLNRRTAPRDTTVRDTTAGDSTIRERPGIREVQPLGCAKAISR